MHNKDLDFTHGFTDEIKTKLWGKFCDLGIFR